MIFCPEDTYSLFLKSLFLIFPVETPSEDFQRVRDYVDVSYCSTLESYKPDKIQQGFNQNMIQQANKVYKINPVSIFSF